MGSQDTQTANDPQVFEKHQLLNKGLIGWRSPKVVKQDGSYQGKYGQHQRCRASLKTSKQGQAAQYLYGQSQCRTDRWKWKPHRVYETHRTCEPGELAYS